MKALMKFLPVVAIGLFAFGCSCNTCNNNCCCRDSSWCQSFDLGYPYSRSCRHESSSCGVEYAAPSQCGVNTALDQPADKAAAPNNCADNKACKCNPCTCNPCNCGK